MQLLDIQSCPRLVFMSLLDPKRGEKTNCGWAMLGECVSQKLLAIAARDDQTPSNSFQKSSTCRELGLLWLWLWVYPCFFFVVGMVAGKKLIPGWNPPETWQSSWISSASCCWKSCDFDSSWTCPEHLWNKKSWKKGWTCFSMSQENPGIFLKTHPQTGKVSHAVNFWDVFWTISFMVYIYIYHSRLSYREDVHHFWRKSGLLIGGLAIYMAYHYNLTR